MRRATRRRSCTAVFRSLKHAKRTCDVESKLAALNPKPCKLEVSNLARKGEERRADCQQLDMSLRTRKLTGAKKGIVESIGLRV